MSAGILDQQAGRSAFDDDDDGDDVPGLTGEGGPVIDVNDDFVILLARRSDLKVNEVRQRYIISKPQAVPPDAVAAGISALGRQLEQLLTTQSGEPGRAVPMPVRAQSSVRSANQAWLARFRNDEMALRVEQQGNGELVKAAELATMLGVTKQAVSKAETDGRLFSLPGPSNIKLYPAFFADQRLVRADLEQVTRALGTALAGPVKWLFFTTPKTSLAGRTPLAALAAGERDLVVRAASAEAGR